MSSLVYQEPTLRIMAFDEQYARATNAHHEHCLCRKVTHGYQHLEQAYHTQENCKNQHKPLRHGD